MYLANIQKNFPPPVAIIGMGRSGQAAQKLLLAAGYKESQIWTYDDLPQKAQYSDPKALTNAKPSTLIVSPGYPLSSEWILKLQASGVRVGSECELAFALLGKKECLIGITGSVGKSTVSALIAKGLEQEDPNCFLGGNFGTPLSEYVLNCYFLKKQPPARFIVLELSSYQLENFNNLSLDVAVVSSLLPNHLERYPSVQSYYDTKLSVVRRCQGPVILNREGGDLPRQSLPPGRNYIWVDRQLLKLAPYSLFGPAKLIGEHNQDNLALALTCLKELGCSDTCLSVCFDFTGLPHRLENIGTYNNVVCINDSKATTVDSVMMAVSSVEKSFPKKSITLLIGGKDKGLPWEKLSLLKSHKRLRFIFFGQSGELIQTRSSLPGPYFVSLAEALSYFFSQDTKTDALLLSPGGTSLDEFRSFEDRGRFFKSWLEREL